MSNVHQSESNNVKPLTAWRMYFSPSNHEDRRGYVLQALSPVVYVFCRITDFIAARRDERNVEKDCGVEKELLLVRQSTVRPPSTSPIGSRS